MPNLLSRRNVLTSAALSAGAVALLKGGLTQLSCLLSVCTKCVTKRNGASAFKKWRSVSHLCVTCAATVNVTSHVLELQI